MGQGVSKEPATPHESISSKDPAVTVHSSVRASVRAFRVLVWRMLGAAMALASTIVVTRTFGPSTAGVYFLSLTLCSIAITVSRLGLDLPTMRLVTAPTGSFEKPDQRSVLRVAVRLAGIVAMALTAALFVGAGSLSALFGEPKLETMIRLTCLGTVPAVLAVLYARGLTGIGRPEIAEFGQRAGFHIFFLGALIAMAPSVGDQALGSAFSLSQLVMCLFLLVVWTRSADEGSGTTNTQALRNELVASGLPLLIAAAMNLIVAWSDTLMIGYFLDPAAVGVYSAAIRVASVVSFVLVASGSVAGPKFAHLLAYAEQPALKRVFRRATTGSTFAAIAIAIPLFVFAPQILGVFGKSFPAGTTPLRVLIGAQLLHTAAGLVGLLLAMAKREKRLLSSTAAAAGLNILLNALLIPRFGLVGAAISTLFALVVLNVLNSIWVYRDLGLSIIES